MLKQGNEFLRERERVLAENFQEVAAELKMIEVSDLIAFIRAEQFASVSNLVQSSTEMFFKPGTVRFGASADIDLDWGRTPTITLDMEFHHKKVDIYFSLQLEAASAVIEINYISFGGETKDPEENTCFLRAAVADARLS